MDNSDLIAIGVSLEEIPCKKCKWALLIGYMNSSCVKFKRKPFDVYYDGNNCEKFEEKVEYNNE